MGRGLLPIIPKTSDLQPVERRKNGSTKRDVMVFTNKKVLAPGDRGKVG